MNMQFGMVDFRFLIYNSKIQILSLQRHLYFWISNNIWQVLTFVLNLKCYGKLIVLFFEYFLRIFSENWISWMIVQKTFSRKISAGIMRQNDTKTHWKLSYNRAKKCVKKLNIFDTKTQKKLHLLCLLQDKSYELF